LTRFNHSQAAAWPPRVLLAGKAAAWPPHSKAATDTIPAVTDDDFMRRALALAERGRYSTSPNPMVGCVIVRDGRVIGEGFHRRAGEPHAEVEALRTVTESPAGATAYVNLEPCCHQGRTPPCVDALIEARLARVVASSEDPNPLVAGQGFQKLRGAGISVEIGLLSAEALRLNEKFLYAIGAGKPFVLLKTAMTFDGKLATASGDSQWITSDAARQKSLELREEYDAILVGSGTIVLHGIGGFGDSASGGPSAIPAR